MTKGYRKLNKKQQEELNELLQDVINAASNVVEDYEKNPSEMSGSITQVHENSPYIATKEERLFDSTGKRIKLKDVD